MDRDAITATLIAAARKRDPAAFINVRAGDLLAALDSEFAPDVSREPTGDDDAAADV